MILILNCGSQSIKWKLFKKETLKLEKKGEKEVLNSKNYRLFLRKELSRLKNYDSFTASKLLAGGREVESYSGRSKKWGSRQKQINIIGHRFVHGGEKFRKPVKITEKVLKELGKFNKLAPLHNPFNILGIKVAKKIFPGVSQIAVFDTEFYLNLPKKAYIYPLPEKIRKKYGFRRFGFHGISHEYVAKTAARKIRKPFEKLKIITCHLGGGSSITATKFGKAIDTSMGFTPMEGLMMMTRSGDIDAGIVSELSKNLSLKKVNRILNFESGLKGISGSGEMLEILKRAKKGRRKARLALEIFAYRIQKYIGAYFAILRGCDLLVFTGTIGSGSAKIRNMICKNLTILKNTEILAIETNEELAIAEKIIKKQKEK